MDEINILAAPNDTRLSLLNNLTALRALVATLDDCPNLYLTAGIRGWTVQVTEAAGDEPYRRAQVDRLATALGMPAPAELGGAYRTPFFAPNCVYTAVEKAEPAPVARGLDVI